MMKRIGALVMGILMMGAMVVTMTGCSEDKDKLIGEWSATIDFIDKFNEGMASHPEIAQYIKLDHFNVTMIFTFKKEGTYQIALDEDAFAVTCEELKSVCADGIRSYLNNLIQKQGVEMSPDDFLANAGTSMDQLISESFDSMDLSALVGDLTIEGNYAVKEGKLYTSDSLDSQISSEEYDTYEFVSNKELKLLESHGSATEEVASMYPITLYKK